MADNLAELCWIAEGQGRIFWYNRHDYCGSARADLSAWSWQSDHEPQKLAEVEEQ